MLISTADYSQMSAEATNQISPRRGCCMPFQQFRTCVCQLPLRSPRNGNTRFLFTPPCPPRLTTWCSASLYTAPGQGEAAVLPLGLYIINLQSSNFHGCIHLLSTKQLQRMQHEQLISHHQGLIILILKKMAFLSPKLDCSKLVHCFNLCRD